VRGKYARRRAAKLRGPEPLPPIYARSELEDYSLAPLRDIARENGIKPGRTRKAELIEQILHAQVTP